MVQLSLPLLDEVVLFFTSYTPPPAKTSNLPSLTTHINTAINAQLTKSDVKSVLNQVRNRVLRILERREINEGIVAKWEELEEERKERRMTTRKMKEEWKDSHRSEYDAYNNIKQEVLTAEDKAMMRIEEERKEGVKRGIEQRESVEMKRQEDKERSKKSKRERREKRKADEEKEKEVKEKEARERKEESKKRKIAEQMEERMRMKELRRDKEESSEKERTLRLKVDEVALDVLSLLKEELSEDKRRRQRLMNGDDDDKENIDVNLRDE